MFNCYKNLMFRDSFLFDCRSNFYKFKIYGPQIYLNSKICSEIGFILYILLLKIRNKYKASNKNKLGIFYYFLFFTFLSFLILLFFIATNKKNSIMS
jgi:hypothetical protein